MIVKRKLGVGRYGILDVYAIRVNQCPNCGRDALKEVRDDIVEKLPEAVWDSSLKRNEYKWLNLYLVECAACGYNFIQEGHITGYYMPESSFIDSFIIDNVKLQHTSNSEDSYGVTEHLIVMLGILVAFVILFFDWTGQGFFKNLIISIIVFFMFGALSVTVGSVRSKKK